MTTLAPPPSLAPDLDEQEQTPAEYRIKATFEEYLAFAEQSSENVQYVNGELLIMGQASLLHEGLMAQLTYLLVGLSVEDDQFRVFGSNIKLFIEATGDSVNADVSIVQGQPDFLLLPSGNLSTATVKNPVLVVEVLSNSTQAFDLGDKLELYKQIPSLQQILFVSQHKPWVSSYVRSETPGVWLNTSAHALTDSVPVLNKSVAMADIYRKINF